MFSSILLLATLKMWHNMAEKRNKENAEKKENKNSKEIDWSALDEHWPEQYKKDYGHHFEKK